MPREETQNESLALNNSLSPEERPLVHSWMVQVSLAEESPKAFVALVCH